MRCPRCFGAQYEVVTPGTLRCTTRVIVNSVPAFMPPNPAPVPMPIYGPCGAVAQQSEWERAAAQLAEDTAREAQVARERREQAERAEAEARQLEADRVDLLARLRAAGNPGVRRRRVPGRYYLSLSARIFGKVGEDLPVDVEPAWPIGVFTWVSPGMRGSEHLENIPTGYTPTERFVPMYYAAERDDVELRYRQRELWRPTLVGRSDGRSPETSDVVNALRRAAKQAGLLG